LLNEFEQELAVIKGRVDGLEARVGTLEAQQFSTTTKLVGQTSMVLGGNSFGGEDDAVDLASSAEGATVFNYDLRLNLNTSFTGEDLLRTRLRAGNFNNSPFGPTSIGLDDGNLSVEGSIGGLNTLEVASSTSDNVTVDRAYYQFPLGEEFTATFGALVRQDDMLAVWPSAYPADTIIDFFTYAGAPGAYSLTNGGGAGIWWDDNDSGWSVSANYVSGNADNGRPEHTISTACQAHTQDGDDISGIVDNHCVDTDVLGGGVGTEAAASNGTAQIAYSAENWGIAGAYSYTSGDNEAGLYSGNATPSAWFASTLGTSNSFALSSWWSPEDTGLIPSISAGWGINILSPNDNFDDVIENATSQSWYVGLQWEDLFQEGNVLGLAGGQPTFVTSVDWDDDFSDDDHVADGNYAFELWYKFQVTDNISVTPAIFYLSRPLGVLTETLGNDDDESFTNFGGLVRTTFKF